MKQNIVIYLSMSPEEGGKFQYSISLLEDLSKIKNTDTEIIACYFSELWEPYLEKFSIKRYKINRQEQWCYKRIYSILNKYCLISLVRKLNKVDGNIYKQINVLEPNIVFYPGNDKFAYEFDFPSVIPIFDLMHRYENFPEVKEPSIFKSREKHYKNICKYAKSILVDSELGKKHVIDCYNVYPQKIYVYPYRPPYYIYSYTDIDVVHKYKLPNDFFFYPAQFWEHKNHKAIIEAVKILKKMGEIINFVFVGSKKNSYDKVVELIEIYGLQNQFYLLGYVSNDELVSLYKKTIALVFPSFFGPTNIPPLEAIALGCPIIVSDVYGHRDQLDGAGIMVNPFDFEAMANAFLKFSNNEENRLFYKKLGIELVNKMRQEFSFSFLNLEKQN